MSSKSLRMKTAQPLWATQSIASIPSGEKDFAYNQFKCLLIYAWRLTSYFHVLLFILKCCLFDDFIGSIGVAAIMCMQSHTSPKTEQAPLHQPLMTGRHLSLLLIQLRIFLVPEFPKIFPSHFSTISENSYLYKMTSISEVWFWRILILELYIFVYKLYSKALLWKLHLNQIYYI